MNIRDKLSSEHENHLRWSVSNMYHIPSSASPQIIQDLESLGLVVHGFQLTAMGRYIAGILEQNHRLETIVRVLETALENVNNVKM